MKTDNHKWVTLDNETGDRTLKQHCFVPVYLKRKYTGEEYTGNISLCGKSRVGNENAEIELFSNVDSENQSETCCKKCQKIFKLTRP